MTRNILPFLCPWLNRSARFFKPEHVRAYISLQRRYIQSVAGQNFTGPHDVEKQKRLDQLSKVKPLEDYHPRLHHSISSKSISLGYFIEQFNDITERTDDLVSVLGRVRSVRLLGSKLMFLDIERDTNRLQIMIDAKRLDIADTSDTFDSFKKGLKVGDWIFVEGHPTKTAQKQLSLLALKAQLLAPCLHHLPDKVDNVEKLARKPHLHQLTSSEPRSILRLRARVNEYLRNYFLQHDFMEVETPMFDVNAGGAIARPFETVANELSNMPIKLRIAPELNLKRLIIGGQDKIYELGRVFRNEGVDTTHNPEFSTCEFYEVGATLPSLIERTEAMISGLHSMVEELRPKEFPSLFPPEDIDFSTPFAKLPFIPTIEKASGHKLPDLSQPNATNDLFDMFKKLDIEIPSNPTLPRLLDALAETYIEPLCQNPTFITEHPEALSPLSKSFVDPVTGQRVAARVELFINEREYVNAYEEENSPFEQRRKFMQQLEFHPDGETAIDESYLEALEWGMPPTGGWGCGLDRLIMLFANKRRIANVLPFGTLRNVVSIAKNK